MEATAVDMDRAAVAADALAHGRAVVVPNGGKSRPVELPEGAVVLLAEVLERLRRGQRVRVVADDQEVTTQEAAELLNVSRPYVVGLIERGELSCRKVGSRRRLRLADVLMYGDIQRAHQRSAADALAAEAQELGLY